MPSFETGPFGIWHLQLLSLCKQVLGITFCQVQHPRLVPTIDLFGVDLAELIWGNITRVMKRYGDHTSSSNLNGKSSFSLMLYIFLYLIIIILI